MVMLTLVTYIVKVNRLKTKLRNYGKEKTDQKQARKKGNDTGDTSEGSG